MSEKITVGLSEDIIVIGPHEEKEVRARIDTGATTSSIDARITAELKLGPIERVKKVKNSNGVFVRPAMTIKVRIMGKEFEGMFTIADRAHLTYDILIGQDILKQGFLVDPSKE